MNLKKMARCAKDQECLKSVLEEARKQPLTNQHELLQCRKTGRCLEIIREIRSLQNDGFYDFLATVDGTAYLKKIELEAEATVNQPIGSIGNPLTSGKGRMSYDDYIASQCTGLASYDCVARYQKDLEQARMRNDAALAKGGAIWVAENLTPYGVVVDSYDCLSSGSASGCISVVASVVPVGRVVMVGGKFMVKVGGKLVDATIRRSGNVAEVVVENGNVVKKIELPTPNVGVGRFTTVQPKNASEAQFLANAEATFGNSATWIGVTRHRTELVIQRSDIELSQQNITRMKNGQAPFVRRADGGWESIQLHHVGRESGKMIEVTRSQNRYNSATGGPLHIPGPGDLCVSPATHRHIGSSDTRTL